MDINDVVKCMRRSLSCVENCPCVNKMVSPDMEPDAELILKVLKKFVNGNMWEKLRRQQMHEIGGPWKLLETKPPISLEGQDDAILVNLAKKLKLYGGNPHTDCTYLEQLENLDTSCAIIVNKEYSRKALAAAFILQMAFRNVVNEKRTLAFSAAEEPLPIIRIPETEKVRAPEAKRQDIQPKVQIEEGSFVDSEFRRASYSSPCTWLRLKDIPPTVSESGRENFCV